MTNALPYKTKQFFFVLIKLSIVVGAFYFIYQKLTNNADLSFSIFVTFLTKNNIFSPKNIVFLVFLSIFNWFLEILKWQKLVSYTKKISFKSAAEQTLGSLTASLFTPNRIGEYGAKAIYYLSSFRKRIMLINLLGNLLQMVVTVILGIIGFRFFISEYDININYYKLARIAMLGLMTVILIGFGIRKSKFTIKGFSLEKIKNFVLNFSKVTIAYGFVLSLLRYTIFSFQFYYLLHIFGVNINYLNAMIIITSMYLLASIIPSIFIFDVIIKGSVAIYLFTFIGVNELTILSIVTIMWLLNFVLPSLFGSFYVLNFNFPKETD
jgi:hypothetical protein